MPKEDPQELVFFNRTFSSSELKQEGFALIRNVAARVHDWLLDDSPIHGEAGRSADNTEEAPPAPPPPPRNITAVLGDWTYADAPGGSAKVDPAAGATLSAPGDPFPLWHVGKDEIERAEAEPYPEKSDGSDPYEDAPKPIAHELTEAEYQALNLGPLFRHQKRYKISYGFKLPYVKRLKPDDPAVKAVLAARSKLPEIPEGKTAGTLQWTKWPALGKNMRPLYGEGWMYCEDARSDYGRWLYKSWMKEYISRLGSPERLPHLAALSTLSQEGAPASLNTYDSCIMTWGVGFACGAPQIVGQLLKTPDFINALYACGFLIQGFEADGIMKTIPGFHYQYMDLSDPANPKVLVWDNYYHFYGYAPGAQGAEISVRPQRDKLPVGDVKAAQKAAREDPMGEKMKEKNKRYDLGSANPMPQANLELSYHIYNPMTLGPGKQSPVLNAFIALARDERTREAVSEANRRLIVQRASLAPTDPKLSGVPLYTEAAYAFVSMCKHNWGLNNTELSRGGLKPFLTPLEWKVVDRWAEKLALTPTGNVDEAGEKRRRELWPFQDAQFSVIEFNRSHCENTEQMRAAMGWSDALIAKAVARKVMSLLEWDRLEEARKRFLKKKAEALANKRPVPTVRLLDERLRKYSYLWRFSRVEKYWKEMSSGANWLGPMRAAARLAGENDPRLKARIDPKAGEGVWDVPLRVPTMSFDCGFNVAFPRVGVPNFSGNAYFAPHTMAYGADEQPDLANTSFCNLGDRAMLFLPNVIHTYGQNLELIAVDPVEVEETDARTKKPKKSTVYKLTWRVRPEGNAGRKDIGTDIFTNAAGNPWTDP